MTIHTPVTDFSASRTAMIDSQLRPQGVNSPAVIAAMEQVERERFVPAGSRSLAYSDRSVPIGGGRQMSSPTVLGLLLTALEPVGGERALVIGCGTGYSAAVLGALGVNATALESDPELAQSARAAGINVVEGSLEDGLKANAPYDLILIDGAIEYIPDAIIAQLAQGGRLGASIREGGIARLVIGRRAGAGFGLHSLADHGAAPLPGFVKPRGFTF